MKENHRVHAVDSVAEYRAPKPEERENFKMDFYGDDVFGEAAMRRHLSKSAAAKLLSTIREGAALDPAIAGEVAHAMKEWALERGATHYTHWFQPLTGSTAEKHDSFLEPLSGGEAIMSFSGKNLIVGEPDASSFPSGGLRSTFEARGYTAWDPTSPAFIKRHANGATLCIPTAFCSYTGAALDKKTPVLRSLQTLDHAVKRLMKCFGYPDAHSTVTLGAEQEYFLIDRKFYLQRPDLLQTGRTLFGAPPPKHQQLEDHYFGAIKPRVLAFMTEVETDLWKLGIPAKTRHNEAAPAQFELAPLFEDVNLAIDHNMLVMEVLRCAAERHGLVCLLHEKPFAGINGSGKHNNWSLSYNGMNLLNPGDDPESNAIFLTVLSAIIKAVDEHSDMLRMTTAYAGNDCRLGANEAPPAIISIFLGDQLTEVIDQLEHGKSVSSRHAKGMRIGVDTLPVLPKDATDRNRTSPFAFTGNKFEFRMPGSSQSCAGINMVLNTIVAESFEELAAEMEKFPREKFHENLQKLLQKVIRSHRRVIFNGDNYSEGWVKEAQKRGLANLHDTMSAIQPLLDPKNIELFSRHGVLSEAEMQSRYEVFSQDYHRKVRIEGAIAVEMARTMITPAASAEYREALSALELAEKTGIASGIMIHRKRAEKIGGLLDALEKECDELDASIPVCHEKVLLHLAALRKAVDALETLVADDKWPLPKYREMLFIY